MSQSSSGGRARAPQNDKGAPEKNQTKKLISSPKFNSIKGSREELYVRENTTVYAEERATKR